MLRMHASQTHSRFDHRERPTNIQSVERIRKIQYHHHRHHNEEWMKGLVLITTRQTFLFLFGWHDHSRWNLSQVIKALYYLKDPFGHYRCGSQARASFQGLPNEIRTRAWWLNSTTRILNICLSIFNSHLPCLVPYENRAVIVLLRD